jgi:hypothetical protein
LLAVAGALALAACGGSGDDDDAEVASLSEDGTESTDAATAATTAPLDPEEAMLAYTECMREHGIDLADPEFTDDGGGVVQRIEEDIDPDGEEFAAAEQACSPIMENAIGEVEIDPEQEAEMRENLLAYAECMREQGIDMPDPVFDEGGRVEIAAGERVGEGASNEEFEAANEVCSESDGPGMVIGPGPDDDS